MSYFQNGNTSDDLEALAEEWLEEREPPEITVSTTPRPVLFDADGNEIEIRRPIGFVR